MLVLRYACNVNVQEDVIVLITSFNKFTFLPVPALYSYISRYETYTNFRVNH
jgi:hypothetical protein